MGASQQLLLPHRALVLVLAVLHRRSRLLGRSAAMPALRASGAPNAARPNSQRKSGPSSRGRGRGRYSSTEQKRKTSDKHTANGGRTTALRVVFTLPGKISGHGGHNTRLALAQVKSQMLDHDGTADEPLQTGLETMPWIRSSLRRREVMLPLQPYSLLGASEEATSERRSGRGM